MISTPLDKALKLVLEDIPKVIQVDCTAPLSNIHKTHGKLEEANDKHNCTYFPKTITQMIYPNYHTTYDQHNTMK